VNEIWVIAFPNNWCILQTASESLHCIRHIGWPPMVGYHLCLKVQKYILCIRLVPRVFLNQSREGRVG
jgi:hypothetical protein